MVKRGIFYLEEIDADDDSASFGDSEEEDAKETFSREYDNVFDGFIYNVGHDDNYAVGYANGAGNYNSYSGDKGYGGSSGKYNKENGWGTYSNNSYSSNGNGQYNDYLTTGQSSGKYGNNNYNNNSSYKSKSSYGSSSSYNRY